MSFGIFSSGNVIEIFVFLSHLVGVTQRHPHHSLTACFERNDVLTRSEHHLSDGHHSLLADCLTDHREGLLPDFAVRDDVIRIVLIQFVNFFARNELVDFDGALTLNRDGFKFFWFEL